MRLENSAKNIFAGFAGQLLYVLLNFIVRTVFIYTLGEEYLGINGLLSSVLSVLNLTELGFSSAIAFAMYKPAAEQDHEKLKSLLLYYRRAYRIIGCVFLGLGLLAVPFLDYLVKGSTDLVDLRVVFVLYLLETTSSYWFFAYICSVPDADQKNYLIAPITYAVQFGTVIARTVFLFLFRAAPMLCFYLYALIGVASNVVSNYLIFRKVRRIYPWVRDKNVRPLPADEKISIRKNVIGLSTNKVCAILNDGIDSTIISALVGLAQTGVFSNYIMLRGYVNRFISTIFGNMTASIGNLLAVESREKKESFFQSLQLTYFWLYGFCAICFWILLNPFIGGIWLHDSKWLLTDFEVFLLTFNFLIEGIAGAVVKYRDASGLFWKTKFRYIASSVLNVALSVVLTGPLHMGVAGALLGTTVSLTVLLGYDPVLVYREVFGKKAGGFYKMYFGYLMLAMATGTLLHVLMLPFAAFTFGNFVIRMFACVLIPNGIWYLIFRKNERFLYLRGMVTSLFHKVIDRLRGAKNV